MKCHYCDNEASKTLVWLKDRKHRPARIELPWCGCDLMTALRKFWKYPYQVVEGQDYEVVEPEPFLGAKMYEPTIEAIYAGLGIPPCLGDNRSES